MSRAPRAGVGKSDGCDKGARKAIEETKAVHARYWRCLHDSNPPAAMPAAASGVARADEEYAADENTAPRAAELSARLAKMDLE